MWLLKNPTIFKTDRSVCPLHVLSTGPSAAAKAGRCSRSECVLAKLTAASMSKFPSASCSSQRSHCLWKPFDRLHFHSLPWFLMKLRIVFAICLGYWVHLDPTFDPANVSLSANGNLTSCYHSSCIRISFRISADVGW